MDIVLFIVSGAAVGFAVGITGVGGGSLMTPLLILMGIPYQAAIGTELLYAAFTKAGGAASYAKQKNVNWQVVKFLVLGSLPAALITTLSLNFIFDGAEDYSFLLTKTLGFMLILTAMVLVFRSRLRSSYQHQNKLEQKCHDDDFVIGTQQKLITLVSGAILGVLVTLSSVGAGALCAALLMVLYPHLPPLKIVGSDIAHAVPLTLVAGLGHLFFLGNVDFTLLACLLAGSLPAVHYGSRIARHIPGNILQPILMALLLSLGLKFAFFAA